MGDVFREADSIRFGDRCGVCWFHTIPDQQAEVEILITGRVRDSSFSYTLSDVFHDFAFCIGVYWTNTTYFEGSEDFFAEKDFTHV